MKAIPYINTMLNDQCRVFVLESFNQESIVKYFEDWHDKDMVGWNKFTNQNNNITFEFYGEGNPYKIKNPKLIENSFMFPYPKNLDQFICDCERCFVDLQWNPDIIDSMNRVMFMDQTNICKYNTELLTKIDKA